MPCSVRPGGLRLRAPGALVGALLCTAAAASVAEGQGRPCILDFEGGGSTRTTLVKLPSERYNAYQGGGVTYHCRGQDNTLIADSAEYYGDQSLLYLIGNVQYREPRARVTSERMTYFQLEDRLLATGNVNVTLPSGTTMRGPSMEYFRATPFRTLARTIATGRPRMRIIERNDAGVASEPVDVVANSISAEGENLVYASGMVEITRPDLIARSDSAMLDSQREFARLLRSPTVENRRDRPFTLRGDVIDLFSRNRLLERVVATPNGHVLSEDLELVADTVDLRVLENKLQRVLAFGAGRARALSPERDITADSIDAIMPGQRLQEVRAIREAYANSVPDTARMVSTERDWMRGDSIIAQFDTAVAGDTTSRPRPRLIVATGDASSFYQIATSAPVRSPPSINYVRGGSIIVSFADNAVQKVDVVEQASGVYLEPSAGSPPAIQPIRGPGALPAGASSQPQPAAGLPGDRRR